MFFTYTLYISLAIFCIGTVYRVWTWFRIRIGPDVKDFSVGQRAEAALKAAIAALFSRRLFMILKVLVLDVIFQIRFLREDFLRWLMHMLIFVGFMLLLLMHALDHFISQHLFTDYYSTVNPFMFLRDLFGVMVLLGLAIAVYRRVTIKSLRTITKGTDIYAIFILAVIMISGILLEGAKITSYVAYTTMVEDYADLSDEADAQALESYWVQNFGVVSPNVKGPFDQDVLLTGQDLHEANCMDCHSSPQWAFTGWAVAKTLSPVALALDRMGTSNILWYIHFLTCFLGLAYLPFSKFFHIFSTPIGLMVNEVYDHDSAHPANAFTLRAMELDTCTRCGTCSLHCSVAPVFSSIPNATILPSEKLVALKAITAGKSLGNQKLHAIQEGSFICTSCHRCTTLCPVGINLQDLWLESRKDLNAKGFPEPQIWAREDGAARVATVIKDVKDRNVNYQPGGHSIIKQFNLSDQAASFAGCMKCITCTVECPVVANYRNPAEALDMMPHQIMHALSLGLKDMVLGSRMIWDCLGCYLCQEKCPMNVNITDVFYELKNIAYQQLRTAELAGPEIKSQKQQANGRLKGAAS
jgi:heterodisulfide reductase subunit C/nitrate reductase gamma subunit